MRVVQRVAVVLGLMCVIVFAPMVHSAEFTQALESEIEAAKSNEFLSVIVILNSPIDLQLLDEQLHAEQASLSRRHAEVIEALKYNASQTQPAFKAELEDAKAIGEVSGYTAYWIENLIVVYAKREYVESLRGRSEIKYVAPNFSVDIIDKEMEQSGRPSNPVLDETVRTSAIEATGLGRVQRELGLDGTNTLFAIFDSGVFLDHPAIGPKWRGHEAPWQECWLDFFGATSVPYDSVGHGTFVAGVCLGSQVFGEDTLVVGAAPGAKWISCGWTDNVNPTNQNRVIEQFQWLADPDGNPNTMDDVPDVVNCSWGLLNTSSLGACNQVWSTAINNCEMSGPVIIFAAGNNGEIGLKYPPRFAYNDLQMFAVGSVDATLGPPPYPLASYSARGPSGCPPNENATKPEIVAPGNNILSTFHKNSYYIDSGTSFAAPLVSGTVALMRQVCPDCNYITIKNALLDNAIDDGYGPPGPDNMFGEGFLDAWASVLAVADGGIITGVLRDASNNPLEGATVKVTGAPHVATTEADGSYELFVFSGSYELEFSKYGYITGSSAGVTMTNGGTVTVNKTLQTAGAGSLSGTVALCRYDPDMQATLTILETPLAPITTSGTSHNYSISLSEGEYDIFVSAADCEGRLYENVQVAGTTNRSFTTGANWYTPAIHGYEIHEDGDHDLLFDSRWFEIDPDLGGPGTSFAIGGLNSPQLSLPFAFNFMGTSYTTAYAGINGQLNFTNGNFQSFIQDRTILPYDAFGDMIAAFFAELNPSMGGSICYYHHSDEDAMIIEWSNVAMASNPAIRQSFQIWLFNSNTNPSGNSPILIQYRDVDVSVAHTVGVQTVGTGVNFIAEGLRALYSRPLRDGRALLFLPNCDGEPKVGFNRERRTRFTLPIGGSYSETMTFTNEAECPLYWHWDVPADAESWLSMSTPWGVTSAFGFGSTAIELDATGLSPGVYTASMKFLSNDPREIAWSYPVELTVTATEHGEELVISYDPDNELLTLRWGNDLGRGYRILCSYSPDGPFDKVLATTNRDNWSAKITESEMQFYRVEVAKADSAAE